MQRPLLNVAWTWRQIPLAQCRKGMVISEIKVQRDGNFHLTSPLVIASMVSPKEFRFYPLSLLRNQETEARHEGRTLPYEQTRVSMEEGPPQKPSEKTAFPASALITAS